MQQKPLSQKQIQAFYHDQFVEAQVRNYIALVPPVVPLPRAVLDVGGGCGYFAEGLRQATGQDVRVLDMDPISVHACHQKGLAAEVGNALQPGHRGDEDVVCFNLMLHHLVGKTEAETLALQKQALIFWKDRTQAIFVDEYIYDAWFADAAGKLIYGITRSRMLSAIAAAVSRLVPSLRANTFGVGVRFRAHEEWRRIFESMGFQVLASTRGPEERVSIARRLLLIRSCRRDSFILTSHSI